MPHCLDRQFYLKAEVRSSGCHPRLSTSTCLTKSYYIRKLSTSFSEEIQLYIIPSRPISMMGSFIWDAVTCSVFQRPPLFICSPGLTTTLHYLQRTAQLIQQRNQTIIFSYLILDRNKAFNSSLLNALIRSAKKT